MNIIKNLLMNYFYKNRIYNNENSKNENLLRKENMFGI